MRGAPGASGCISVGMARPSETSFRSQRSVFRTDRDAVKQLSRRRRESLPWAGAGSQAAASRSAAERMRDGRSAAGGTVAASASSARGMWGWLPIGGDAETVFPASSAWLTSSTLRRNTGRQRRTPVRNTLYDDTASSVFTGNWTPEAQTFRNSGRRAP